MYATFYNAKAIYLGNEEKPREMENGEPKKERERGPLRVRVCVCVCVYVRQSAYEK